MPGRGRGEEPADGGDVADHELGSRRAATREPVHRPPARSGLAIEPARRVGRAGIADDLEQLDVLAAVGVGKAPAEVDAVFVGESDDGAALARAPQVGSGERPGELAVDHFEPGAEHVLDVEVGGHRLHLERQRRRRQDHGVALALVGGDERACLGVHTAGELLLEQLATELVDLVDRAAPPRPAEHRDDGVVVGLTEHEADAGQQGVSRTPGVRRRGVGVARPGARTRRTRR